MAGLWQQWSRPFAEPTGWCTVCHSGAAGCSKFYAWDPYAYNQLWITITRQCYFNTNHHWPRNWCFLAVVLDQCYLLPFISQHEFNNDLHIHIQSKVQAYRYIYSVYIYMLLYPCHRWKCIYIYKRMNLFGIQCKTSCVQCPITLGPVTVIHFQSPKERMATDDSDDPGDNDAEDAVLGLRKLWKNTGWSMRASGASVSWSRLASASGRRVVHPVFGSTSWIWTRTHIYMINYVTCMFPNM